ncbi:MAG TPA: tetratricopeptide repeat protein [Candidatus Ozemobacteraceae bacterium]|nr:tetratricopeptide repeat protein [Candidatus Ozemobacteraceae bacterium]HQG27521.1 tetratricopeptide repeat protein [Candidatus Ozemobacteraceae bacterium]
MRTLFRRALPIFLPAVLALSPVCVGAAFAQASAPAVPRNPNDAVRLYHEAMNEYSLRHLKAARDHLNELVKEWPDHPLNRRARIELARVCVDLREYDRAIELLSSVAEGPANDGDTVTALESLVELLFTLQRFKLGVDLLEKRWQANPNDVDLGKNLAKFYLQTGRSEEAQLLLENLLERTSRRDVFADLLKLATKTGTVERLMSAIQQRSARYRAVDYLEFVTDCLMSLARHEEAMKMLRESPETRTDIGLLRKLARLELEMKDPAASLQTLRQIEQLLPNEWETAKAAGHCLFLLGKPEEAVEEWRRHLSSQTVPRPDGYQLFTEVLIEHKLYPEALEAFAQARQALGNPAQFAEERAGVLEAMGRHEEALGEYLAAMANGMFKADIFEKLYTYKSSTFDLREKLKSALATSRALSLKKAMLEVLMRGEAAADIPEIAGLLDADAPFEELLYERIRQGLAAAPTAFLHTLCLDLVRRDPRRELALKLCRLLLDQPDLSAGQAKAAFDAASAAVALEPGPDAKLRAALFVALGHAALERFSDTAAAETLFAKALQPPLPSVAPSAAFDAALWLMRLHAARNEMPAAEAALATASTFVSGKDPMHGPHAEELPVAFQGEGGAISFQDLMLDPEEPLFEGNEGQARLLYETAWLQAQRGDYQNALDTLRKLTEEYPESLWMDDGLRLALLITMGSTGNMDGLKILFEADRLALTGKAIEAVPALESLALTASGTPLALDAAAKALLFSETASDAASLMSKLDAFVARHPAHWAVPDLMMLHWRLMKRSNAPATSELELLKQFVDRFPGDLRSRRARLAIADLLRRSR